MRILRRNSVAQGRLDPADFDFKLLAFGGFLQKVFGENVVWIFKNSKSLSLGTLFEGPNRTPTNAHKKSLHDCKFQNFLIFCLSHFSFVPVSGFFSTHLINSKATNFTSVQLVLIVFRPTVTFSV